MTRLAAIKACQLKMAPTRDREAAAGTASKGTTRIGTEVSMATVLDQRSEAEIQMLTSNAISEGLPPSTRQNQGQPRSGCGGANSRTNITWGSHSLGICSIGGNVWHYGEPCRMGGCP
eukprot:5401566-Amphidinium_carterae.1